MGNLLALTSRELKSLWFSPILYVVGALFLVMQGWVFWLLIVVLSDPRVDPTQNMAEFFFGGTFFYWFSALITAPLLTMRTFSEEKRTGSIELLLTAPVTNTQVVVSKFLGAWFAYDLLWAATLPLFLILQGFGGEFDWAPVLTGYLGTWLLGGVLIALGVLASSLTRNQVISAVLVFVVLLLLFSVGFLGIFVRDPDTLQLIEYLSITEHLRHFSKGFLDTRPIVCYASLIAISLFLTVRTIASPWFRS